MIKILWTMVVVLSVIRGMGVTSDVFKDICHVIVGLFFGYGIYSKGDRTKVNSVWCGIVLTIVEVLAFLYFRAIK